MKFHKFQKFLCGLCSSWTSWELGLAASKWTRLSATVVDHRTPPRCMSPGVACCGFQQNKVVLWGSEQLLQLSYGVTVWQCEALREKEKMHEQAQRKSLNQSQQKRRRFAGFFFQLNSRNSDQTREFARVHRVYSEFAQKRVCFWVDSWDWSKLVNS